MVNIETLPQGDEEAKTRSNTAAAGTNKQSKQSSSSSPSKGNTNNSNSSNKPKSASDKYDELMLKMQKTKEKWDEEDKKDRDMGYADDKDEDRLLSQALDLAIEQGRGWSPGEKEEYLEKILDDDFIPPMFCSTQEEIEKSGLQEAFTSLIYDDETPTSLYLRFKKMGTDAFADGKRNEVGNMRYYRDAINHYYESLAWAEKIEPLHDGDLAQADTDDPTYTPEQLAELKSNLCSNIALMNMQLKNWGFVRDECNKALEFHDKNVKAYYRLAKAYENLKLYEDAGNAIESGLSVDPDNKDLKKLQRLLDAKIRKARTLRQQRERARAERTSKVKQVWKYCKESKINLGRVPLVNTTTDDGDDDNDSNEEESRWHQHLPHSGRLPLPGPPEQGWSWPCMFLYPSHNQSDFIEQFPESEMLAMIMAQMFPEMDGDDDNNNGQISETPLVWDQNNEFVCSNLAIYFEVHNNSSSSSDDGSSSLVHPESVEVMRDQASGMRFYESCRALKGDEGSDLADIVRAIEKKRLAKKRKAWKSKHGSLYHKDDVPVVRVHPAVTLREILRDNRMVVPNFLVTFFLFPENHPSHQAFLKQHKCLGIIQPKDL